VSGTGRPAADAVDGAGLTLALVATRWHAEITNSLVGRALGVIRPVLIDKVEHVRLWDQDALNVVLDDGWQRLPAERHG